MKVRTQAALFFATAVGAMSIGVAFTGTAYAWCGTPQAEPSCPTTTTAAPTTTTSKPTTTVPRPTTTEAPPTWPTTPTTVPRTTTTFCTRNDAYQTPCSAPPHTDFPTTAPATTVPATTVPDAPTTAVHPPVKKAVAAPPTTGCTVNCGPTDSLPPTGGDDDALAIVGVAAVLLGLVLILFGTRRNAGSES